MILQGNAPLAAAYAANIIAIYQTYRWNAYVEAHRQDPQVWHGLVDNDSWQAGYLQGDDLDEIRFWLGTSSVGGPPPPAPRSASSHRECKRAGIGPAGCRREKEHAGKGESEEGSRKEEATRKEEGSRQKEKAVDALHRGGAPRSVGLALPPALCEEKPSRIEARRWTRLPRRPAARSPNGSPRRPFGSRPRSSLGGATSIRIPSSPVTRPAPRRWSPSTWARSAGK